MYNKLFSKIVDSSIWMEPDHVRLIWMMFIAIMDEDGFVNLASVKNVAHRAVMPLKKAKEAIEVLESPDPESSNPANDGRRLTRVPGGWIVNNAKEYREIVKREHQKELNRERVRKCRTKPDQNSGCNAPVMVCNDLVMQSEAEAEAEAEADTEALNTDSLVAENPAPKPTPAEVVLVYPCSGKAREWRLTESQLTEWQASYSGLDVLAECKKALQWLRANRLKTAGGMPRFLVNWLNRANDRPSGGNGRMMTPAQQREANMKANLDEARRAAGLEQFQGMIRINHERKTDG